MWITSMPTLSQTGLRSPTYQAELLRLGTSEQLDRKTRTALGQFMTPEPVARFMASLFTQPSEDVFLLDPGAGVGSLTAAFIERFCHGERKPVHIHVDAYEIDPLLSTHLETTLTTCERTCEEMGIRFSDRVFDEDFLEDGAKRLSCADGLFSGVEEQYTHCIMNPPYKKIRADSQHRVLLRKVGVETSNLYTGFLALAIMRLSKGGELVAIVPRSFCNGAYFRPFRRFLLEQMALTHLHVFHARDKAFGEDRVLQENVIFRAVKRARQGSVIITSSNDPSLDDMTCRQTSFDKVVGNADPDQYIHIATTDFDQMVVDRIGSFTHSLGDLDLDVCTGPVVDFRLRPDIHQQPTAGAYPLVYPAHFHNGRVEWPNAGGRKPNSISQSKASSRWLMPNGWYVVTKRFSAKEERRRIVAAVHDPKTVPGDKIGFENHLNVFHRNQKGLRPLEAKGLAFYLNSSLVDLYFRQFSGHTQVNATDLRMMHYPDPDTLVKLGKLMGEANPKQKTIDSILEGEIREMAKDRGPNPIPIKEKINDTLSILNAIGLPKQQKNERSALTLLALLGLRPENAWTEAGSPLMGITPLMDFIREHYGKTYAPNTRETVRRQTMHQFVDAGIAVPNPECPSRPTNSPKWVYQIEPNALDLIRTFGSPDWNLCLPTYLGRRKTLVQSYAKARKMQMIPLVIDGHAKLKLTPGAHSELIKNIVEDFGPRFVPGAEVLYVGDTGAKLVHFMEDVFQELGLEFDSHGKFPDVVLYWREKNWVLLIESVTSHGPVDAKRHSELAALFAASKADLVYVTAFPNRQTMAKYLPDISWETDVWVADSPTHLIHFDGHQFLGPYAEGETETERN
jgi:adenine-specific DNA-methyltransferase